MPASVELISSFMIQLRLLAAERLAAGIVATSVTIADLGVTSGAATGWGAAITEATRRVAAAVIRAENFIVLCEVGLCSALETMHGCKDSDLVLRR